MQPERVTEERLDPSKGGKGTPDMPKDLCGSLSQRLKMLLHIGEQKLKSAAVMIMRHDPSRDVARAIQCGWPQDHRQAYTPSISAPVTKVAHAAHEQGASRRVGLEIVGNHDGHTSTLLGTSHGSTHLLAEHIGRASRSDSAIEPAIAPVHQAKAIDLAIIPRRFDQALPTSTLATPHAAHASGERPPASHLADRGPRVAEA